MSLLFWGHFGPDSNVHKLNQMMQTNKPMETVLGNSFETIDRPVEGGIMTTKTVSMHTTRTSQWKAMQFNTRAAATQLGDKQSCVNGAAIVQFGGQCVFLLLNERATSN